ncbi:hypothetical protein [Streptomyces sp. NPDC002265]|uniref:hypothetical protein n=1 Tax=Streptomyces sp. NPDC002265 TaxID=3154415 RepID=UPI0033175F37
MAKEMVTVCLPPEAHGRLRPAIEEAMAPFDMNGDHEPYQGEWDQWWLGREGDEFDVLPGHEDDPRLVRGPLDADDASRPETHGRCYGGPRGLLDFDGMRARAARLAATLDPDEVCMLPFRQWQPEQVIPREWLLTLDGAWIYGTRDDYLDFANAYLDDLPPDVIVVRLRIHC